MCSLHVDRHPVLVFAHYMCDGRWVGRCGLVYMIPHVMLHRFRHGMLCTVMAVPSIVATHVHSAESVHCDLIQMPTSVLPHGICV